MTPKKTSRFYTIPKHFIQQYNAQDAIKPNNIICNQTNTTD